MASDAFPKLQLGCGSRSGKHLVIGLVPTDAKERHGFTPGHHFRQGLESSLEGKAIGVRALNKPLHMVGPDGKVHL